MRRDAPLQPVSEVFAGDLFFGLGLSHSWGGTHPLSGFTGDLLAIGEISIGYGLGDRAVIMVNGPVHQRLSIDERAPASIPLDPSTNDGTATDAGDFRIATAFTPIGSRSGMSAGALVEVKLPNTTEQNGVGPNTTDVTLGLLGSWGGDRFRGTGLLGVAILEAPLEDFEQNDLVAYALDVRWRASPRLRLFAGLSGLGNTRRTVPLGTESRGSAYASGEWAAGPWRLDLGVHRGFVGDTPDWRVTAGVSWSRSSGGSP
ncbi:MAG: hypothetical protein OEU54_16895 [Gemmatimonadota bacterium]|nr:hypothetical protein [Gemmatimonadota bacterium]